MSTELIPALDPTPIPGPAWLFHTLLVFTFFLHAVFMNLTLGGTLLAAVGSLASGGRPGDFRTVLAGRLMGVNAYGISMAITTGVAPLLFVQVLYQQYFYTATILIGWVWFGLLVLLLAGYYAAYAYKFRAASRAGAGSAWLTLAALMFLLIAMVHVAVQLTHARPGTWETIAASPWAILEDPTYIPRLLHFVLAAIGFSGLVAAWWAAREAASGRDVATNAAIAHFGFRWALWTTLAQVVAGFVLLFALPREVMLGLMRGGAVTLAPLSIAILLAIGLLMMLSRVSDPVQATGLASGALATMFLVMAVMVMTRHQVRGLYLAPATSRYPIATDPQWDTFAMFVVLLACGLATVLYIVHRVRIDRV